MTWHLHDGRESCHVSEKIDLFREFDYLNSLCSKKSIISMFLSSSRDKFTLTAFVAKQMFLLVFDRHVSAHPYGHKHGAGLHTNLYKFG